MSIRQTVDDQLSAFQAYVGIKPSALLVFAFSIAGAALVATAAYWGVFGYKHWTNEMTVAQRIMTAAATTPLQPGFQVAQPVPQAQQSGQYVCPVHGAVGLPRFNTAGTPICPIGGEVMQFRSIAVATTPAAFAGG